MSMTSSATPARPPSLAEVMRRRRPPRNINKEAAEKTHSTGQVGVVDHHSRRVDGVLLDSFCVDGDLVELEYVGTRAVTI